jgi:hypothetical protein
MGAAKKLGFAAVIGGAAAYAFGRARRGRGPLVEYERVTGERQEQAPTPTNFDGDRVEPSAQLDRSGPTPTVET